MPFGCAAAGIADTVDAEEPVGRRLDPEVDLLAALAGLEEAADILAVPAREDRAVGQAVEGRAFGVEDQRLAVGIEAQRHIRARPGPRYAAGEVEPGVLPGGPPLFADLDRAVVARAAAPPGKRHRLIRDAAFTRQWHAIRDDLGWQTSQELANVRDVQIV